MPKPRRGHDDRELRCSFCGKSRDQVLKLIAGPHVYICGECVELCNEIIGESEIRAQVERAVSEVMTAKVVGQLDESVVERIERAMVEVREALGNLRVTLADCLQPLVAEALTHLTCPHCGKRLDEPTSPPITPSDAPLKEV